MGRSNYDKLARYVFSAALIRTFDVTSLWNIIDIAIGKAALKQSDVVFMETTCIIAVDKATNRHGIKEIRYSKRT